MLCINLLSKHKKNEQRITNAYEMHIKENNLSNVRYEYFDFHDACSGQKFEKINPLITKLSSMNENFRFYVENLQNNTVLITQKGYYKLYSILRVMRINCIDCLDRTNFTMTKLAALTVESMLRHFDIDLSKIFEGNIIEQLDNNNANHPFIIEFKNIWADNGDTISKHYTGTGSTHTNITRTGKRDFFGLIDHGMKTLGRFYMQNFEDNFKQNTIDIILGETSEKTNVFLSRLEKDLKQREREFAFFEDLSFFVISWNVKGFEPSQSYELGIDKPSGLLYFNGLKNPDILVFCLQEVLGDQSNSIDEVLENWSKLVKSHLSTLKENYILLIAKHHINTLISFVFVKQNYKERINNLGYDTIKFGILRNKGALVFKFNLDDTSFCVINACLEHGGNNNINNKLNNIKEIHTKIFQSEGVGKKKDKKIEDFDYKFLVGDTNFKIALPLQEVMQFLEVFEKSISLNKNEKAKDVIKYLLTQDEFNLAKDNSDYLRYYFEPDINFLPNSKYEPYSTLYQNSVCPSWADRIFLNTENKSTNKFYERKEYLDSENRPIVSYFEFEVKRVNNRKREEIIKEIYDSKEALISDDDLEDQALRKKISQIKVNKLNKFN